MSETPEAATHLVGGRYEIVRDLAAGGMARVYVARHHLTRQEVALKIIESAFARDAAGVSRFLREVSVASRIQHEGVVKVFDAGFDPELGAPYLAMELLDGRSMATLLSERTVDQAGAMALVLALLDPLAAAHDVGVIHRDLKPENVFVTRGGEVKLLDFGVARDLRGSRTATTEGTALGTVYYMAPEQALDARSVSAAADVYALGVTMYQIVCGIFPFDGTTPHAVLIRANRDVATPVATRAPWLHADLAALVDRCLEKDPNERPADAATLRGLLAALLARPEVVETLRGRAVNPATFLSTPPPPDAEAFSDPFESSAQRASATPPAVTLDQDPRPIARSMEPIPLTPRPPEAPAAAPRVEPRAKRAWLLLLVLPAALLLAWLWPRTPQRERAAASSPVAAAPVPPPAAAPVAAVAPPAAPVTAPAALAPPPEPPRAAPPHRTRAALREERAPRAGRGTAPDEPPSRAGDARAPSRAGAGPRRAGPARGPAPCPCACPCAGRGARAAAPRAGGRAASSGPGSPCPGAAADRAAALRNLLTSWTGPCDAQRSSRAPWRSARPLRRRHRGRSRGATRSSPRRTTFSPRGRSSSRSGSRATFPSTGDTPGTRSPSACARVSPTASRSSSRCRSAR
ncbi:MAG: serine/threonine-protein kinase [Polyangiales bacterium]